VPPRCQRQPSPRRPQQCLRHHFQRCPRPRPPPRRPPRRQPLERQAHLATLTIALWTRRTSGTRARRHGAARFTTLAALPPRHLRLRRPPHRRSFCPPHRRWFCPLHHLPPQTHSTAPTASRTGRQAGASRRKNGAARTTARAALRLVVGARRLRSRTIARLALPTGWPDGLWPRRHGAARTRARVALQPLEVAPELEELIFARGVVRWPVGHLPAHLTSRQTAGSKFLIARLFFCAGHLAIFRHRISPE